MPQESHFLTEELFLIGLNLGSDPEPECFERILLDLGTSARSFSFALPRRRIILLPECLSLRLNWPPPPDPSPASECVPPAPLEPKGWDQLSLSGEGGRGGEPIRTSGEKAWHSFYSVRFPVHHFPFQSSFFLAFFFKTFFHSCSFSQIFDFTPAWHSFFPSFLAFSMLCRHTLSVIHSPSLLRHFLFSADHFLIPLLLILYH